MGNLNVISQFHTPSVNFQYFNEISLHKINAIWFFFPLLSLILLAMMGLISRNKILATQIVQQTVIVSSLLLYFLNNFLCVLVFLPLRFIIIASVV